MGLSIREFDNPPDEYRIAVFPPEDPEDVMLFKSYRDALSDEHSWNFFGDLRTDVSGKDVNWLSAAVRSFRFSSLEELDLQLSVRGF